MSEPPPQETSELPGGFTNGIVRTFLDSNLPMILLILSMAIGLTALMVTPREEDPQIVVPMADVYVSFPGRSAAQVEQLVSTPLERMLYQIDGVEYVYSMSRQDQAIITVRFRVGQDRERSLVKLYKKIDENVDLAPAGVTGWVVKPVEIDDVPIVTLTLRGAENDSYTLRRLGEEMVARLAAVSDVSRAYVIGGQPRKMKVYLDPQRMRGFNVSPLEIHRALAASNTQRLAGDFTRTDTAYVVESGKVFQRVDDLRQLVVGVFNAAPVYLKDVAGIEDGPDEVNSYVRHSWGGGRGFAPRQGATGTLVGDSARGQASAGASQAVTIALAKKKGSNAVTVARDILSATERLKAEVVPADVDVVITRNSGLSSDDKVNDLIEALGVALVLAVVVLTVSMGWRESLIVALAVPVVFGLTLGVNLLAGMTINRVTLFALILSLGLLVDDPIVDVENIVRHFTMRRKASRAIVLEAVSEIRPPLISATLAIIASFLPLLFISGMMGPYMRPMALNVPVTMLMSLTVAFTLTPWLAYHLLRRRYNARGAGAPAGEHHESGDLSKSLLYRLFRPIMNRLLRTRRAGWTFLAVMGLLLMFAAGLAMLRVVPLKMLPYGNKDELQLVLDFDEGTTLERADAAVRDIEQYLATVPEVTDYTSYVGLAAPMDFNGMVRHYYLRRGSNVADIQVNLVGRKHRHDQSHALGLRMRENLGQIAARHAARLKIVEPPPGPPVLSTVVAEVYGQEHTPYDRLVAAAGVVRRRLAREPGVVDVDDMAEATQVKLRFVPDQQKAALNGISVDEIARTHQMLLGGATAGTVQESGERNPLTIDLRLPRELRSSEQDLANVSLKSASGAMVPLAELGRWDAAAVDQTIYHKNLRPVMYVLAEMAGRAPAEAVLDIQTDRRKGTSSEAMASGLPRPMGSRSYLSNGGGIAWSVPSDINVNFSGEGEWDVTLDVFRDMGLAFIAALIAIYILLVHQTRSFAIPLVVMMAIPLTIIGIMPGFWLLNVVSGGSVGGFATPTFFTATAMIGMIALAGIVTRGSIIIVDFIHLSLARGASLKDAIVQSCVVRLRPILLTAGVSMLAALPIATDPVFSGLAWALIFGLLASTVFTLVVVPVTYYLLYANKPGHGLPERNS
ncbi:MAG: efflux RND transporter permease subunit [Planctomycetaceae bacterium]|nr:efflux RND transporter permease subunit [Planctomycetaceae bacterium]